MILLRILLCFLPLLTLSLCGGSDLPDDQVEEVLALYQKHCKDGSSSSSGGYGSGGGGGGYSGGYGGQNVNIVCKEGQDYHEAPTKQVIRIPPSDKPKKNILFVEAPAYKVKHEINLISSGGNAPKTVIYVLPQKASHALNVVDNRYGSPEAQKPQVFFLKGKGSSSGPEKPIYGPPDPPEKPIYGPPLPVKPIYGLPNQDYGYPLGSSSESVSVQQFDPAQLGPNYELIPADGETQNNYQQLFSTIELPSQNQPGPQIQIQSYVQDSSQQSPKKIKVSQTSKSFATLKQDYEPPPNSKPEVQVQPLEGNLFASSDTNSYASGRVIFPEESIQNFNIQQFKNPILNQKSISKSSTTESPKSLGQLLRAFETRRNNRKQEPQQTTPKPQRLNLFDLNYIRGLISTAKNASGNFQRPLQVPERLRIVRYSDRQQDNNDYSTINYNSHTRLLPPPPLPFNSNSKRSVQQNFEIIPAKFISYSYSKSDN